MPLCYFSIKVFLNVALDFPAVLDWYFASTINNTVEYKHKNKSKNKHKTSIG
jgi:hypothetical protein